MLSIKFDTFFDKLRPLYENNRCAAYRIINEEVQANLGLERYMVAVYKDKPVGTIEIATKETPEHATRVFQVL